MSGTITIGLAQTVTQTTSGTYALEVSALSKLDVTGSIAVDINQIAGLSALVTMDVNSGAELILDPIAQVSALSVINVGADTNGTNPGNGTLELGSQLAGVNALSAINFAGSHNEIILDPGLNVNLLDSLNNFAFTDTIALRGVTGVDHLTYTQNTGLFGATAPGGTLSLDNAGGTVLGNIVLTNGTYTGAQFTFSTDPIAGTDIGVTCFLRGTAITTPAGEVPVESLAIGDLVVTSGGSIEPIKWIGRRAYGQPFITRNRGVQPVEFSAGALGEGLPRRPLLVSGQHALLLDGMLIPAECLINNSTIRRRDDFAEIEYFHIELAEHAAIFAEAVPAESFADDDSRAIFHNASEYAALYPLEDRPRFNSFAPRVTAGPALDALRARIAARAGVPGIAAPGPQGGDLIGFIDHVDRHKITGWAFQPAHPETPVLLDILDGTTLLGQVLAEQMRPDIASAGFGFGNSGFSLHFSSKLAAERAHDIVVRRAADQTLLQNAPWHVPVARLVDAPMQDALRESVAELVAGAPADDALDQVITTLDDARRSLLTRRLAGGALPGRITDGRATARHALVIDEVAPEANHDAGSDALLDHMRALAALGYRVSFLPASGVMTARARSALAARDIECLAGPFIDNLEAALRLAPRGFDVVYLHRPAIAARYAGMIRHYSPRARIIFNVADLESLRLSRQALATGSLERQREAALARAREQLGFALADAVITHSTAEAEMIRAASPHAPVHVIPWSSMGHGARPAWAARHGVGFLAHYAHVPNRDAAFFLLDQVMPIVWQHDPSINCVLAGTDMPGALAARAEPRVIIKGHVPDLAELFDEVRLMVAPLRFGAGAKGKVMTSLAAGLPCAMTPIAAEGLGLPDMLDALIAEDAAGLAARILRLHQDEAANQAFAAAGLDWATSTLAPARIDSLMAQACGLAARQTARVARG
ncbi:MAG: hypothetical protein B7Z78_06835 [Rhodospirillales bacterium 20-60-12]|nr:MAG: hypothetical protein B7Z78_06835 [Rhodospirillales bacterium 20-60-12]HQT66032.1 Hint domain-containing protein [Acetobacteraceae bacterium]